MKKIVLAIFLMAAAPAAFSQELNQSVTALKADENYEYCQILGESKFMSTKLTITVDYGQEWNGWTGREKVKDEEGKVKKFNSMIDALNYMSKEGWEFVQAYAFAVGNQNVYH